METPEESVKSVQKRQQNDVINIIVNPEKIPYIILAFPLLTLHK